MYPIRWRFKKVYKRLDDLINRGDASPYESFALAIFVVEKLIRRTLYFLIMKQENKSKDQAEENVRKKYTSLRAMIRHWHEHDTNQEGVEQVIGKCDLAIIEKANDTRDILIHGENDPGIRNCKRQAKDLFEAIPRIRKQFKKRYKYSGWKELK